MWNRNHPAVKLWDILYPVAVYYAVLVIAMFLFQGIFGADEKHYMLCQILATLAAIPVVYHFYRQDAREKAEKEKRQEAAPRGKTVLSALWIAAVSVCAGAWSTAG